MRHLLARCTGLAVVGFARALTGVRAYWSANGGPRAVQTLYFANHNSHVDTFLILTMFPARTLARVRPAAAADYFLANPVIGWFSRHIIGIVPVERTRVGRDSKLHGLLLRYSHAFMTQLSQSVACNTLHPVEKRLCRWLLTVHDRVADQFPLTHEFLAAMLGVPREKPRLTGHCHGVRDEAPAHVPQGR